MGLPPAPLLFRDNEALNLPDHTGKISRGRSPGNAPRDESKRMGDKGSKLEEKIAIYKATQWSGLNHLTIGLLATLLNLRLKVWVTLFLTRGLQA